MLRSSPPKTHTVDLWLSPERPHERLLQDRGCGLSAAELITVCLGGSRRGEPDLTWANRLLTEFGGLDGLLAASPQRLLAMRGLGTAKVALLKALYEITLRHEESQLAKPEALTNTADVARYLRRRIGYREREVFGCLFLDTRHRPICWEELFLGSLNRAHVYSREVLRRGLEINAAALILGHNHPSGVA